MMALKVILPTIPNSSRAVNIVTSNSRQLTLEQLQGVDISQVEDGYILLYNAGSGNFEASPFSGSLGNLDGGTF